MEEDVKAVSETLMDALITCGPRVEEAEHCLAEITHAKYAVVVSNGTAALHCACIAAGIQPEGGYSDNGFWHNVNYFNYTFLRNSFRMITQIG